MIIDQLNKNNKIQDVIINVTIRIIISSTSKPIIFIISLCNKHQVHFSSRPAKRTNFSSMKLYVINK